jgi:hypothetical protein
MNNQSTTHAATAAGDYLNTTIVFGEVKKAILSKNFQGGNVHILFGSTELDFTYADIKGVVVLDILQGFGETKVIVPMDWRVETDLTHFCSTADDKRRDLSQTYNSDKILVITGVSVFASVKILSGL